MRAAGDTRDLSYRDLEKYALITETKIQDTTSPVLTGQYVTKTPETAIFKYILTGVDDSALDLAKPETTQPLRQAAQLELLDHQIREIDHEIAAADNDQEELERLDSSLDAELAESFQVQEETESDYQELTGRRRQLRREYVEIEDRVAEIDTLLARFRLLEQHYGSDQDRLAALIEAGTLFALEVGEVCPVCGAEPGHHRPAHACDGNVDEIIEAAKAEAADVQQRAAELKLTMEGLTGERGELTTRAGEVLPELRSMQALISREVPSVQTVRRETNQVIARKLLVQKSLDLVGRREKLLTQRTELGVVPGYDSTTIVAQQSLGGTVLDSFCEVVEAELQAWEFPGGRRVFFELQKMDISVAGKSRSANGKGVRALLHGAFSIGLMKYCKQLIAFILASSSSTRSSLPIKILTAWRTPRFKARRLRTRRSLLLRDWPINISLSFSTTSMFQIGWRMSLVAFTSRASRRREEPGSSRRLRYSSSSKSRILFLKCLVPSSHFHSSVPSLAPTRG
jgi:hypothetical protein